jgi:hypothetical protein
MCCSPPAYNLDIRLQILFSGAAFPGNFASLAGRKSESAQAAINSSRGGEILTEWSKPNDSDFLARVAAEWDEEQNRRTGWEFGSRLRFAIILGKDEH